MAEPIYMRIGEGSVVDLPEFVGAMGNFLGLLKEVDSTITNTKAGNLRWKVTTLRNDPSPIVGVTPAIRRTARSVDDTSELVERELISNVKSITERGERNRYLSDAALSRVSRIAKTAPKLGPSAIYATTRNDVSLTTSVTVKTLDQLHDITRVGSVSFGTVTGKLDTISVRKGFEFRVWDEDTDRPVRCWLDAKQSKLALELLGIRVLVTGILKADHYGRPLSMEIETLDAVSLPGVLPSIAEMRGLVPNFTGGLSLREFFEDFDS